MFNFSAKIKNRFLFLFFFLFILLLVTCRKTPKAELSLSIDGISDALKVGVPFATLVFREGSSDIKGASFTLIDGEEVVSLSSSSFGNSSLKLKKVSLNNLKMIKFTVQAKANAGNKRYEQTKTFEIPVYPSYLECDQSPQALQGLVPNQVVANCSFQGQGLPSGGSAVFEVENKNSDNPFIFGDNQLKSTANLDKSSYDLSLKAKIGNEYEKSNVKFQVNLGTVNIDFKDELFPTFYKQGAILDTIVVNSEEEDISIEDIQLIKGNEIYKDELEVVKYTDDDPNKKKFLLKLKSPNLVKFISSPTIDLALTVKIGNTISIRKKIPKRFLYFNFKSSLTNNQTSIDYYKYVKKVNKKNDIIGSFVLLDGGVQVTSSNFQLVREDGHCLFEENCATLPAISFLQNSNNYQIKASEDLNFDSNSFLGLKLTYKGKDYLLSLPLVPVNLEMSNTQFKNKDDYQAISLKTSGSHYPIFSLQSITCPNQDQVCENLENLDNIIQISQGNIILKTEQKDFSFIATVEAIVKKSQTDPIEQFRFSSNFLFTVSGFSLEITDPNGNPIDWYNSFISTTGKNTYLGEIKIKNESNKDVTGDYSTITLLSTSTTNIGLDIQNYKQLIIKGNNIHWKNVGAKVNIAIAAQKNGSSPVFISTSKDISKLDLSYTYNPLYQSDVKKEVLSNFEVKKNNSPLSALEGGKISILTGFNSSFLQSNSDNTKIELVNNLGTTKTNSLSDKNELKANISYAFNQNVGVNLQYHQIDTAVSLNIQPSELVYENINNVYNVIKKDVNLINITGLKDNNLNVTLNGFSYQIESSNKNNFFGIADNTKIKTITACDDIDRDSSIPRCSFIETNGNIVIPVKLTANNGSKIFFTDIKIPYKKITAKKDDACINCKKYIYINSRKEDYLFDIKVFSNDTELIDQNIFSVNDNERLKMSDKQLKIAGSSDYSFNTEPNTEKKYDVKIKIEDNQGRYAFYFNTKVEQKPLKIELNPLYGFELINNELVKRANTTDPLSMTKSCSNSNYSCTDQLNKSDQTTFLDGTYSSVSYKFGTDFFGTSHGSYTANALGDGNFFTDIASLELNNDNGSQFSKFFINYTQLGSNSFELSGVGGKRSPNSWGYDMQNAKWLPGIYFGPGFSGVYFNYIYYRFYNTGNRPFRLAMTQILKVGHNLHRSANLIEAPFSIYRERTLNLRFKVRYCFTETLTQTQIDNGQCLLSSDINIKVIGRY